MQGSLDDPPIIIEISRAKILVVPFIAAAIGLIPAGMRASMALSIFTGLFFLVMGLGYSIWQLFRPSKLILSPNGLTWGDGSRGRVWQWRDFESFHVRPFLGINVPACRFSSSYNGPLRNIAGGQGMFLAAWEMAGGDVVALLNAARERWGRVGPWGV
jgi:hypothetical protein